ncbi:MAG: hypothetical protein ACP5NK_00485 [Thermoplasmata archaeon]
MKSSIFKILVVTVTLAVIVPSVYLIVNQYKSSLTAQTPQSFIPANSNVAVKFNALNESNYAFLENQSLGLVLQMSTFAYTTGFNSSSTLSNSTATGHAGSFHYYYYETYDQVPIFNTSVNLSKVLSNVFSKASSLPLSNLTSTDASLNSVNLYIASPVSGIFVMGEINAVHAAIDSNQRTDGYSPLNFAFNTSANISLFANLSTGNSEYYVSGNFTSNTTVISLYGRSVNNTTAFLAAVQAFSIPLNGTVSVHSHSITLTIPVGTGSKLFSQLFKYLGLFIS